MPKAKILVIEDDAEISEFIALELAYEGYEIFVADDGNRGLAAFRKQAMDLIILDRMLPGLDGLDLCRKVRQCSEVPIIMISARGQVPDRITGLEHGADDFLPKPFDLDELLARIRVQLRRRQPTNRMTMEVEDLVLDIPTRLVRRGTREIRLTVKEFDLLAYLMRHSPEVIPRERLLNAVWGYDFGGDTNVLDVYVGYLRRKIDSPGKPRLVHTIRGIGHVVRLG
ncbi:MAG: response regulator transcription factor [Cyanobacteria bacterium NC_groundwater_1444_Ag_S-0.65um_54_12]|nr:response regulator transcription factor [Cyanobacteria bacterium NC_groundwater_1444_Ag_S-0.65um_54_12]